MNLSGRSTWQGVIDLEALTVTVRPVQAELQDGRLFAEAPKSTAGVRSVR
ncbi:hypothetical protein [Streptomyces sp. NPDC006739]